MKNIKPITLMLFFGTFLGSANTAKAQDQLLAAMFICNAVAEVRILSVDEAQECLRHQTALKIALLDDLSMDDYAAMITAEQAEIGRKGYQVYLAWKDANPDLVDRFEAEAREIAMATMQ
ncbi:MAG: hypothetical protein AAGK00_09810 [Pseudomonadota bacterium]